MRPRDHQVVIRGLMVAAGSISNASLDIVYFQRDKITIIMDEYFTMLSKPLDFKFVAVKIAQEITHVTNVQ